MTTKSQNFDCLEGLTAEEKNFTQLCKAFETALDPQGKSVLHKNVKFGDVFVNVIEADGNILTNLSDNFFVKAQGPTSDSSLAVNEIFSQCKKDYKQKDFSVSSLKASTLKKLAALYPESFAKHDWGLVYLYASWDSGDETRSVCYSLLISNRSNVLKEMPKAIAEKKEALAKERAEAEELARQMAGPVFSIEEATFVSDTLHANKGALNNMFEDVFNGFMENAPQKVVGFNESKRLMFHNVICVRGTKVTTDSSIGTVNHQVPAELVEGFVEEVWCQLKKDHPKSFAKYNWSLCVDAYMTDKGLALDVVLESDLLIMHDNIKALKLHKDDKHMPSSLQALLFLSAMLFSIAFVFMIAIEVGFLTADEVLSPYLADILKPIFKWK